MVDAPSAALLAATSLHAGFQLTVTVLVYPALARVPESGWAVAHGRHSTAITPLVGVVYAAVLAAAAWCVLARPLTAATVLALLGTLAAFGATGLVAAPLHGRLGREGPVAGLLTRLRRADLVRTGGAVAALVGAALVCAGR